MTIAAGALAVMLAVAWPATAWCHSLWVSPPPRDQQDGYKDPPRAPPGTGAPCGIGRMVPPQPETKSLTPGQTLTVSWSETVTHPGCFVVDFATAGDAGFQILGVKSHAGAAGGTPRPWTMDVTLPNVTCSACTLRLRQLMLAADVTEAQCPPNPIPAGATYYSCANVALGDGTNTGATGGAGGSGTAPGVASDSGGGCACATFTRSASDDCSATKAVLSTLALALAGAIPPIARRRRRRGGRSN